MTHQQIKTFIEEVLTKIGVVYDAVDIDENNGQTVFQINTSESGKLIGSRGDTIRALNHIAKKAFEGGNEDTRFLVDVNGYRMKKITDLEQTARMLAERARTLKYNVEMTPMTAYERMIVHSALANEPDIRTESHGEGRDRRVVICYTE